MNDPAHTPSPEYTSDVLWACVEDGFHVGSRGGDFLGYVDRQSDGRFRAFDARSTALGDFSTLSEATHAVGTASSPTVPLANAGDSRIGTAE